MLESRDTMKSVWAFDIGASNGRLILNSYDGRKMYAKEIYRFSNYPALLTNHYYWDILHLFTQMKTAMRLSIQQGHEVESMGIDTWGVDFGLLAANGELLANPYSYRNSNNVIGMKHTLQTISSDRLFQKTGVEIAPINTLFQLLTIKLNYPQLLEKADQLLMMPNLLAYFFSGIKNNEFTISTTTQMLDPEAMDWDTTILDMLEIDRNILSPVVPPLSIAGETLPAINEELQIDPIKVINVPGHDTACALAAMPLEDDQSVFMSCGTWVIIGIPVKKPVTKDQAMKWGFTNEGTIEGSYRLQKNMTGMWLLQQCRIIWEREGMATDFEEENRLFKQAKAFYAFIDPDDRRFFNPNNMVNAIKEYCRETNQRIPETRGQIIRCILESLVLKYGLVIKRLEKLSGIKLKRIHMSGGAIRNQHLCQLIANATDLDVLAGPVESSSIGNAISQWLALGEIETLQEARKVVQRSFPIQHYQPRDGKEWEPAYQRFLKYMEEE